jgi:hypothetical protein
MIELGGKRILRIWGKHEPEPGHLADVKADMATLGPPTVRCVEWRGEYYALEGSHRLRAAFDLGLVPNLTILSPERLTGEDEQHWEWIKNFLPDYCWEIVASFEFAAPAPPHTPPERTSKR